MDVLEGDSIQTKVRNKRKITEKAKPGDVMTGGIQYLPSLGSR